MKIIRATAVVALCCAICWTGKAETFSVERVLGNDVELRDEQMASSIFKFSFNGVIGKTYPVLVSSDLTNWTLLTNIVSSGALHSIADESAPIMDSRYFRVGPVPPTPIENMVYLPPGSFTMGSPASETDREAAKEGPQTVVTLTRGFWICKFEVRQWECIALTGTNHAVFAQNPFLPIDFASWAAATNYCQTLTEKEIAAGHLPPGYRYRLPTEAEWEYACRAGTTTPVAIGDGMSLSSTNANFDGAFPYGGAGTGPTVGLTTLPGHYSPNAWGLYDMHGNVAEWCSDYYGAYPGGSVTDPNGPVTGTTRVLRGGGFNSPGQSCRSARRDSRSPTFRQFAQGFRVVLSAAP